jgi:hypothetical protein
VRTGARVMALQALEKTESNHAGTALMPLRFRLECGSPEY